MLDPFRSFWVLLLLISLSASLTPTEPTSNVYIVYLGINPVHDPVLTSKSHVQLLRSVFSSDDEAEEAIVYSYKHSFSGFSAMLNSTQATTLAEMEEVISVFRSKILSPHTTRSWDFMGLTVNHGKEEDYYSPMQLSHGGDVVVGILDTGVWPEMESFKEAPGMGPVPSEWKGACVSGDSFDPAKACNRKLIGARYYVEGFEKEFGQLNTSGGAKEYRSPRDRLGHGTHTASTAVGSLVANASFMGFGLGMARGGAPLSRLAVYKICWFKDFQGRCTEADILAAFDDALRDGVDVISCSFGASPPLSPFFSSSSDIGAFHATQLGVAVVFSAGNDGPEMSMVQNVSPWGICVAAATIDRTFPTKITLGNNVTIMGESFVVQQMETKLAESSIFFDDGVCDVQRWRGQMLATDTVILCFSTIGSASSLVAAVAVSAINGSGMIFAEPLTKTTAQDDFLPSVHVDVFQGTRILHYIQASKDPKVKVLPATTTVGHSPAPMVAYFSSRGPSTLAPNILKPDLAAPGVQILAAWPPRSPPTMLPNDGRFVKWNFDSGTSMSCPHVSGVVALLRSAHPDWSPAAIRSALMTTAYNEDMSEDGILARGTMKAVDPFDVGAGHINPLKALDPGLVYDADARDYILFLCSIGYNQSQIMRMVLPTPAVVTACPESHSVSDDVVDLNYPAIVVSDLRSTTVVKRTVRNVDGQVLLGSIYCARVVSPEGVRVTVEPRHLVFTPETEKLSYLVILEPLKRSQGRYDFGEIVWSSGRHSVRSPIGVRVTNDATAEEAEHFAQIE